MSLHNYIPNKIYFLFCWVSFFFLVSHQSHCFLCCYMDFICTNYRFRKSVSFLARSERVIHTSKDVADILSSVPSS